MKRRVGIERVCIKKLRLASRVKKGDRITLEANVNQNSEGVYELLESIGRSVNLALYDITQVEFSASIVEEPDKPSKRVTFHLTYPNTCSLKYDERGLKLRAMLEASGLEPKEPAKEEGDA